MDYLVGLIFLHDPYLHRDLPSILYNDRCIQMASLDWTALVQCLAPRACRWRFSINYMCGEKEILVGHASSNNSTFLTRSPSGRVSQTEDPELSWMSLLRDKLLMAMGQFCYSKAVWCDNVSQGSRGVHICGVWLINVFDYA